MINNLKEKEQTIRRELTDSGKQILKFTRSLAGRVFLEQYELYLGNSVNKGVIQKWLNDFRDVNWIEGNENEEGVVTIPCKRKSIDELIKSETIHSPNSTSSPTLSFAPSPGLGVTSIIKQNQNEIGECFLDPNTYGINLSLTKGKTIESFCLNDLINAYLPIVGKQYPFIHFCSIQAQEVTFKGDTKLLVSPDPISNTSPWFSGLFNFSGSIFEDDVVLQNIEYRIAPSFISSQRGLPVINFRACRFMKGIKIQNLNMLGASPNAQISFEDTVITEHFRIFNADFSHAKLNCLQMVLKDYVFCVSPRSRTTNQNIIMLKNISLAEDAHLDLSEVEALEGKVSLENIPSLCNTTLRFKKQSNSPSESGRCPYIEVVIRNCTLKGVLELCNIDKLWFHEFNNAGSIISSPNEKWGENNEKSKSTDHLVIAIKNHLEKSADPYKPVSINECAQNLAMLKKNYASLGMNDSEDAALIAYMNYNHHPDHWYSFILKGVYRLLDITGKYGTSPVRILLCLLGTWILSAVLLFFPYRQVSTALAISVSNLLPFSSVYYSLLGTPHVSENCHCFTLFVCAVESVLGSLLLACFAIAIVRKTMR